jgi:hypothetical protein
MSGSRFWARTAGLLAALVCVAAGATPAHAGTPPDSCGRWSRQVYAITTSGGLTAETICLDPAMAVQQWTHTQVIATSGWGDTYAALWSGEQHGSGRLYYRVAASTGALYWSRDLTTWKDVGQSLGDWRRFTSIISPAVGVLDVLDDQGSVFQLTETDWVTGSDVWTETRLTSAFGADQLVGADGESPFLGMARGATARLVGLTADGAAGPLQITVPQGVVPAQVAPFSFARYRTAAMAITLTGRLALLLPIDCSGDHRIWAVKTSTGAQYAKLFLGEYLPVPGEGPVEWQCDRS